MDFRGRVSPEAAKYWTPQKIISDLIASTLMNDPDRKFLYCWEEAGLKYLAENPATMNAWTYDRVQEWKLSHSALGQGAPRDK
jgi:hypothetical protein